MSTQGSLFCHQDLPAVQGKDEMNVAEYPITLLSKKPIPGVTSIEYGQDDLHWKVTGSAEYGLPIGGDQDIYVAIMETWKENNFSDRRIEIESIHRLLKRIGISTTKRDYERFKLAVKRLAGITIYAENAFYDNDGKKYDTIMGFHLFDDFRIVTRRGKGGNLETPKGYIRASEVLWSSVKKGYVKNLNITFYTQLSTPCVKRIYRFLDKKRYAGNLFRMNLYNFAKKIGLMAGKTKYYPAHVKKDITPAMEELKEQGFLEAFKYEMSASGNGENILCVFSDEKAIENHEEKALIMDILAFTEAEHSVPYYRKQIRELGKDALTMISYALSAAKEAYMQGDIKTTKDQYFIGILKTVVKNS